MTRYTLNLKNMYESLGVYTYFFMAAKIVKNNLAVILISVRLLLLI